MFEHVLAQVQTRLGAESAELRAYRRSFENDLGKRWRVSTREELLASLEKRRLILLADFHALQQSQKTHLRLLEALEARGAGPFVLALECVPATAQKAVNQFLDGTIAEKEFLKKARWDSWGFPWEHYEPLFRWARRTKSPVLAVDLRQPRLKARDRFAAKRMAKVLGELPDHRLIAVFGDLHLAHDRLPAELAKLQSEKPFRVFQNSEKAAFRLLKKGLDHKIDVIRFDPSTSSIQNIPPWVKWQNYLLWLDQSIDQELESGETPDLTDPVADLVRWMSRELGVDVDAGALTVYTADDPDLWARIRKTATGAERPWIEMMIEDERSFYLSSAGWGYLARPSVNHAASLAAQFMHDQLCGGAKVSFRFPQDFQKMIWIESIAFFGSKIVNPKRKSDTLADIRSSLSSRKADDRGREALRLALSQKMTEMMDLSGRESAATQIRPRMKASWIAASHLLGALMGERLYHGYRRRLISTGTIQAMLRKPLVHAQFSLIYRELVEIIEALPAPFRSKREKL